MRVVFLASYSQRHLKQYFSSPCTTFPQLLQEKKNIKMQIIVAVIVRSHMITPQNKLNIEIHLYGYYNYPELIN